MTIRYLLAVLCVLGSTSCETGTYPDSLVESFEQMKDGERLVAGGVCSEDFSADGYIAMADLVKLLTSWGECAGCDQDLNRDGSVSMEDLTVLLDAWGPCETTFSSPVHLAGYFNDGRPTQTYSNDDLEVMASRFEMITGLENHGYSLPGAIADFRAFDKDTPVFSYIGAMTETECSDFWETHNSKEEMFMHSGDPASFRVFVFGSQTVLWFRADKRNTGSASHCEAPGVSSYVIERSTNGIDYQAVETIVEDGSEYHYTQHANTSTQVTYRVRSRFESTGSLVDYSWATQPEAAKSAHIAWVDFDGTVVSVPNEGSYYRGSVSAVCFGSGCPSASNLKFQIDANASRAINTWESVSYTSRSSMATNVYEYAGYIDVPYAKKRSTYRAVSALNESVSCPLAGNYSTRKYNNRLFMQNFDSFLMWPDHETWVASAVSRLGQVLDLGYSGLHLDFTLDDLTPSWIASGLPADWQPGFDMRLPNGMMTQLRALKAAHPKAKIQFNGFFVNESQAIFNQYLDILDVASFEFFAYGVSSGGTRLMDSWKRALEAIIALEGTSKQGVAIAGRYPQNIPARLSSLSVYLLGVHEGAFYTYGVHMGEMLIFPEWDVPLGQPTEQIDDSSQLQDSRAPGLWSRSFENGEVLLNTSAQTISLNLDETMYLVKVQGGALPEGQLVFEPVTSITLSPVGTSYAIDATTTNPSMPTTPLITAILLRELPPN